MKTTMMMTCMACILSSMPGLSQENRRQHQNRTQNQWTRTLDSLEIRLRKLEEPKRRKRKRTGCRNFFRKPGK